MSHNRLFINALQNLLFRIPKVALLQGKSVGFALQKSRFRNAKPKLPFFFRTIFTKQGQFYNYCCPVKLFWSYLC
ncbi:hypothetical protein CLI70_10235 [Prevotella intermedia]|nr:hypothetical protein CLI70_10235 [Prevotella intermedia]